MIGSANIIVAVTAIIRAADRTVGTETMEIPAVVATKMAAVMTMNAASINGMTRTVDIGSSRAVGHKVARSKSSNPRRNRPHSNKVMAIAVAGMAEHLAPVAEVNMTAADTVTVVAIAVAARQFNRRNRQRQHPHKDRPLQQNLRAVGVAEKAMAGVGPSVTKTDIITI